MRNVKYDHVEISAASRINYLRNLREFSLVPCPEGNGFDTFRLWETIYMGGTPIIIKNAFLPKSLENLPVIQLDTWEKLKDLNHMEKCWYALRKRHHDYRTLTPGYWIAKFTNQA